MLGRRRQRDGSGIMSAIPCEMYEADTPVLKGEKNRGGCFFFFPNGKAERSEAKAMAEKLAATSGLRVLEWRDVPVDRSVGGVLAESSCPRKEIAFVSVHEGGEAL